MRDIENEGYRDQVRGLNLISDNPYAMGDAKYGPWRKGWLEAWRDSH